MLYGLKFDKEGYAYSHCLSGWGGVRQHSHYCHAGVDSDIVHTIVMLGWTRTSFTPSHLVGPGCHSHYCHAGAGLVVFHTTHHTGVGPVINHTTNTLGRIWMSFTLP